MKQFKMTAIGVTIGLVFSAGVMAQSLSKDSYKAAENRIADEYRTDKVNCDSLSGNKKDICRAEAKGKEKVAEAELEARYEPTAKHLYQALIAKADADYAIAHEKCDDMAGNDKDVCVKEAKAVETRMKADADAQMTTFEANQKSAHTATEAAAKAREEGTEARQDATKDTLNANYAVAKEKCDALANEAKERCMDEAKATYGQ